MIIFQLSDYKKTGTSKLNIQAKISFIHKKSIMELTEMELTEQMENKLDLIVDDINELSQMENDSIENSDGDDYFCEFSNMYHYSNCLNTITEDSELLKILVDAVMDNESDLIDILQNNCEYEFINNISGRTDELLSTGPMGEIFAEYSDSVKKAIDKMTDTEFDYIKKNADVFIDRSGMYLDMTYCRFAAVLNIDDTIIDLKVYIKDRKLSPDILHTLLGELFDFIDNN